MKLIIHPFYFMISCCYFVLSHGINLLCNDLCCNEPMCPFDCEHVHKTKTYMVLMSKPHEIRSLSMCCELSIGVGHIKIKFYMCG